MKRIFTLLFLFTSYCGISQPTLQSSYFPSTGASFTSFVVDATAIYEGPAGANQSWSYTSLTPLGTSTSTFVNPASTPFGSSFAGATRAMETASGGITLYTYYNHNTTATELSGYAFNDPGTGLNLISNYTNPQRQFQYPVTFGQQFTDNFTGGYTVVYQGVTITNYRYGTITSHVDAYGTITIPTGTYANTLRVRARQLTTDSSVYVGFPVPPDLQYSDILSYTWYGTTTSQFSLFQVAYDTTYDETGFVSAGKSAGYLSSSVGVSEVNLKAENTITYPNPAKDFTHVNVSAMEPGEAILKVYDASGRLVKNQEVLIATGSEKHLLLHLEEFNYGLYQLTLTQKNVLLRSTFVKQ